MEKLGCNFCKDSQLDPGWIRTNNTGPSVPCPVCNWKEISKREFIKIIVGEIEALGLKDTTAIVEYTMYRYTAKG